MSRSAGALTAEAPPVPPLRILFVCTGNTCRSAMAEAIARRALAELGWSHAEVCSAGVAAVEGDEASPGARRAARRRGVELEGHRARRLSPAQVAWADLVLAMGPRHLHHVEEAGGAGKSHLLTDFAAAPEKGEPAGVPDPFGGSDTAYDTTFTLLEELIERALQRIPPPV